ncbi:MAG: DUF3015 domain-containing protein [Proteobacteria bacterium]|nr:DUF3015 domain-containing protein [Pseudomonadota bacterium]
MKRALTAVLSVTCAVVLLTATSNSALADAHTSGPAYGPAGCGLGAMLLGSNPGFVQVFAATTNGTFGNQTFGITSGTLGCANTAGGAGSTAAFVETNREVLVKDISRGSGETIAALSTLAGCSDPTLVGRTLQSNFSTIFPSAAVSDKQVGNNVVSVLRDDKALACRKL